MGLYKNVLPVNSDLYAKPDVGSTEVKVIDALGYIQQPVQYVTYTSAGLSVSTAPAYGVTYVLPNSTGGDFSTSPAVLSLGAPIPGVAKTVVFASTAGAVNTLDLYLGGGTIFGSSGFTYVNFSSLGESAQVVNLMGLTTALWAVTSVTSTIGSFGFSAAGIRGSTAARTS